MNATAMATKKTPPTDGEEGSVPGARLLDVLREAALAPVESGPSPVRHGSLGACVACKESVASHFDQAGRFLGCASAADNTTFVLVPVDVAGKVALAGFLPSAPLQIVPAGAKPRTREFFRARYLATLPEGTKVDTLPLSPQRRKVLTAVVRSGDKGFIAKDVERASGLPHGAVQEALNWLRGHNLVAAREDITPK